MRLFLFVWVFLFLWWFFFGGEGVFQQSFSCVALAIMELAL